MTANPASLPEILKQVSTWLDRSQPVGRLTCTSSAAAKGLRTATGHLHVGAIQATCLRALRTGLVHASIPDLQILRIDVSGDRAADRYCRQEIDDAMFQLGRCLLQAHSLSQLRVRLASFDEDLNRVRLSHSSWQALILGLNGIARFKRLKELELSYITIKEQQAVELHQEMDWLQGLRMLHRRPTLSHHRAEEGGAGAPQQRTFLDTLAQLSELEALWLTHDEIFGTLLLKFAPVIGRLKKLRLLDLTRNHISKQVMLTMADAVSKDVQILGGDSQTFYFN